MLTRMSDTPRWLTDDEQELWRQMLAAARTVTVSLSASLQEDSGLSSADYAVLVSLSEADGGAVRLRDMCTALQWDRSRASHQVTRMQSRGLVSKEPAPGDARGILISITEEGQRRIAAAAPGHVDTVRRLVFDHLDPDAVPAIERFLAGVLATGDDPHPEEKR